MSKKRFFTDSLKLVLWAIGLQAAAFVYDMFDGDLTSPVWDPTYNWAPFLIMAIMLSMGVSALRGFAEAKKPALYRLPEYSRSLKRTSSTT